MEVIRTVGGSSLLIGWERPPLDELGCSNGTFVYGYRVKTRAHAHKHTHTHTRTYAHIHTHTADVA